MKPKPKQRKFADVTHLEAEYRWQIQFIFGTANARLINLKNDLCKDLNLEEAATEENFREIFEDLCTAMVRAGIAHEGDQIRCTTFPEGAKRFESRGAA